MEVIKSRDTIYPIGILWNLTADFARQMMLELAIDNPIMQARIYQLGDSYGQFVQDCYKNDKDAQEDGYINIKVGRMLQNKQDRNVVVFVARIDDPTYIYDEEKKKMKCKQVIDIKMKFREKYKTQIDDYLFDVLFHMTDDAEEIVDILNILPEYESFIKKEYVRTENQKYLQPIKNIKGISQANSYCKLLKALERKKECCNDEEELER